MTVAGWKMEEQRIPSARFNGLGLLKDGIHPVLFASEA
jgi:hypothetical protein